METKLDIRQLSLEQLITQIADLGEKKFMTYDKVIDSLVNDEVDFAIIIHESRFCQRRGRGY